MTPPSAPAPAQPAPSAPTRFAGLDSLRGLAALAVVMFHFYSGSGLDQYLRPHVWEWVHVLTKYYFEYGADFFFVLSGFVIAHVLGARPMDAGALGNFALRRTLRVGPPYWATIALVLGLIVVSNIALGRQGELPGLAKLLSNLAFLQMITGHGHIVYVAWTLCYEMQFYLVAGTVLFAAHRLPVGAVARERTLQAGLLALFALSLLARSDFADVAKPWFIRSWYAFGLGMATNYFFRGRIPALLFAAYFVIFVGMTLRTPLLEFQVVLLGVVAIISCVRLPALDRALTFAPLHFLGLISYSLYLIHGPVGWRLISILEGRAPSTMRCVALIIAATVASIIGAALMYWAVERPAVAWSQKLKRRTD